MQISKNSPAIRIDPQHFEMPSVPVVLSKILQSVDDNSASARRLEELILHDPSLSVRILKLSNSAFYSFRSEVKTIAHAITLLGLNLVRSLAIGVSIFESFSKGMREEAALINQLWMHSFGVGIMAQEIFAKRGTRSQGEFALLCGLLHDLGKVVYFKKDHGGYAQLFGMEKGPDEPDLSECETARYGVDHASLGSVLTKEWHLPSELSTVVRRHHDTGGAGQPLVAAVAIADALVKQAGIGYDGDRIITADLSQLQLLLHMEQEELDHLTTFAIDKRADVEDFFHLST
jgi:putative nucleotidyltransferase with HDIG domain